MWIKNAEKNLLDSNIFYQYFSIKSHQNHIKRSFYQRLMTICNAKKIRRGMMSLSKDQQRVLHLHLKLTLVYEINFGDLLLIKIFCVLK